MKRSKFDSAYPLLRSLHWLPVEARVRFKILLLVYKCLSGCAPDYLKDLISEYVPSRALRSASDGTKLCVPRTKKAYGDRAFRVAAPRLWNDLPVDLRGAPSLTFFKQRLKTHLFLKYL